MWVPHVPVRSLRQKKNINTLLTAGHSLFNENMLVYKQYCNAHYQLELQHWRQQILI